MRSVRNRVDFQGEDGTVGVAIIHPDKVAVGLDTEDASMVIGMRPEMCLKFADALRDMSTALIGQSRRRYEVNFTSHEGVNIHYGPIEARSPEEAWHTFRQVSPNLNPARVKEVK